MGILTSAAKGVEELLEFIIRGTKGRMSDYVDLETANDQYSLVSKDGSYLSVLKIEGTSKLMSSLSYEQDIVINLSAAIATSFEKRGYKMQFWFEVDPEKTKQEVADILAPAYETCEELGLDLLDVLKERENVLPDSVSSEACYMVLWTTPAILTKQDIKNEKEEKSKFYKNMTNGLPNMKNSQNPLHGYKNLIEKHHSFVDEIIMAFNNAGVRLNIIDVHKAINIMRSSIDTSVSPDWKPALPGDLIMPNVRQQHDSVDEYQLIWPDLGKQIATKDGIIIENNVVEMGNRIYYPIYIDLFARQHQHFSSLFAKMANKDLPWRISFLIEGGGIDTGQFKAILSQILSFASSVNKLISEDYKAIKEYKDTLGGVISLRATLCTWADKGQINLLRKRASDLSKTVEGWGSVNVSEVTGDPIAGLMSTSIGLTQGSIATKSVAPIDDAFRFLPLSRPSSPWENGAVTFKSSDGKIMPYQPYSSLQITWISLIFAKPGSGKSVLLNVLNLALCLAPKIKRLPRIAIIDVGPSSSGLISLIKEALPNDKKHLATYRKLRNEKRDCINPFDTQLGSRFPTPVEKQFLINFLSIIVSTDNNHEKLNGLVSAIIDLMYRKAYDTSQDAKVYNKGINYVVDDALEKLYKQGVQLQDNPIWWEVVDVLFENDMIYEASVAQRYAVPVLSDATACVTDDKIKAQYSEFIIDETKEPIIAYMSRMIVEALDLYKVLGGVTQFDLSESRIVALNLEDVAIEGADKMSSTFYMLARQLLGKDFYIHQDEVVNFPVPPSEGLEIRPTVPVEKYKSYHLQRIESIREDPKRLCYDEFHKASKFPQVTNQVVSDMRVGRKYLVDIILATQTLNDYPDDMIKLSTGIFVMSKDNNMGIKDLGEKVGFNNSAEIEALRTRVHPPGPGGAGTFLAKFDTKYGDYTLLLSTPLGPIELWAFSTTSEDMIVRNKLYEKLGPKKARFILSKMYPSGSIMKKLNDMKSKISESGGFVDEEQKEGLLTQIVNELVEYANK